MTRIIATMHPTDRAIFRAILGYVAAMGVGGLFMLPVVVRAMGWAS